MPQKFFTNTLVSNYVKLVVLNSYVPLNSKIKLRPQPSFFRRDTTTTKNYYSKTSFYDSLTHELLGDYLRAYRDTYGVDLMPLYNCFSYRQPTTDLYIELKEQSDDGLLVPSLQLYPGQDLYPTLLPQKYDCTTDSTNKGKYKSFLIPVKSDKVYTILLSSSFIRYKFIYYNKFGYLEELTKLHLSGKSGAEYNVRFSSPFKVGPVKSSPDLLKMEKVPDIPLENYLYLFITLPAATKTSILVLEGDYTNKSISPVDAGHGLLSLLSENDGEVYLFSDRLIEYLLDNVIGPADLTKDNVLRVQDNLERILGHKYYENRVDGVWDYLIRKEILSNVFNSNLDINKLDILGYVDKDVEKFLEARR